MRIASARREDDFEINVISLIDVLLTLLFHLTPEERQLEPGASPGGVGHWSFGPDYAERMTQARDAVRERIAAMPAK